MNAQINHTLALLQRHLGDDLLAVHLFGSAVDGGLKPGSDIDLLGLIAAPLDDSVRQALMQELLANSAWPASEHLRPLEVTLLVRDAVLPWRYPAMRELQFGEWLRDDLLAGHSEPAMPDHDLAIMLSKVRQHSICLLGAPAAELYEPVPASDLARALHDTLAQWNEPADWQGDECNVVLAVARIWLTLSSGKIAAKDVAASWLLERLPEQQRPLLEQARAIYLGEIHDKLAEHPREVAAFIRYARERLENLHQSIRGEG